MTWEERKAEMLNDPRHGDPFTSARAALAVLREPNAAMMKAGLMPWRWNNSVIPPSLELPFGWTTDDAWRAMVDAILSEADKT
jgi:hypothetical protein